MGAVGKVAAFGVAAAAVGIGVAAVDLGLKAQNAGAQLDNAFKNAGTNTDKYKSQIAGVDAQMTKYGYSNAETETALARLVGVTGNVTGSLKDMGLAADIAKNRHIDLNSAVDLMAKTMAGNVTAAKRMGIEIPANILKIKDPTEKSNAVLALLEGHFKGSAAAAAGTFAGRMQTLKAQAENLGESFGKRLIPILQSLVTKISEVVTWFEKHKAVAEAVGIAITSVLLVAIAAYIVSMASAAVATIAATWPILLIIAAVALVGVAIFELHTHWKQVWAVIGPYVHAAWSIIRPIFEVVKTWLTVELKVAIDIIREEFRIAWSIISTVISVAWSIIRPIWDLLKSFVMDIIIPAITLLMGIWGTAWTVIQTALTVAWSYLKPVFGFIKTLGTDIIKDAINGLKDTWSIAWSAIKDALNTAWSIMSPVIDTIKAAIHDVQAAWDWLFGGGSSSPAGTSAPPTGAKIPHRAAGGPLGSGQTALVGENGPELFTPGSSGTVIPNNALGGSQTATAYVTINLDGQTLATAVQTVLLQKNRGVPTLGFS